jgi:hypothetical protein
MHRITFPVAQPLAGFDFGRSLGYRHSITQLPAPIVTSIAFAVALTAVSQLRIELAAGSFVRGNKPINPLMTNRLIGPLKLESLSNLLRTHTVLQPCREMCLHPRSWLTELACTCSASITFLRCNISLVGLLRGITTNLPTDGRGCTPS